MSTTNKPIFRASAMRHYMQNQEKSSYLRLIPLPITIFVWLLLALFIVAGYFVWDEEIPTYVSAAGLVVSTTSGKVQAHRQESGTRAVLFLPPTQAATLHVGTPVRIYVGGSAQALEGHITAIAVEVRSPADIHARYEQANCSLLVTQPVTEVTVMLPKSAETLNGSMLTAQIEARSQRLLTLLPWVGQFFPN